MTVKGHMMKSRWMIGISISLLMAGAVCAADNARAPGNTWAPLPANPTMMQPGAFPSGPLQPGMGVPGNQGPIMGNMGMGVPGNQGPIMGNMGMGVPGNQGPIMGNMGMTGMGPDPSLADPQMGLLDPVAVLGPGIDPSLNSNQNTDAPGVTNPFSIQSLVQNANSRVSPAEFQALETAVQAYLDGNLGDARKLFTDVTQRYQEGITTDRAYLGLSKIERAYGAYDVSRRILEAVIRKNRDYESIMLARRAYRDLGQEVIRATNISKRDMETSYMAYKQISWWNVFSKIRAYNEYKDTKANYDGLLVSTMQFDPVFSMVNISTPVPEGNQPLRQSEQTEAVPEQVEQQIDQTLSIDEVRDAFSSALPQPNAQPTYVPSGGNVTADPVIAPQPAPVPDPQVSQPAPEIPAPAEATSKPVDQMSMDEARAHYLDVYNKLKEALKGSDNQLKKDLQNEYRAALNRYNQLRNQ